MNHRPPKTPTGYDRHIKLPLIRNIRAAEDTSIINIFNKRVNPDDSILEIGPGTGYYTIRFARAARKLTAVDSDPSMAKHLERKVERLNLNNIEVITGDFLKYSDGTTHDWVIALGVLEYQQDPSAFLDKIISHSHKWVLITFPTPCVWGHIYRAASRLRKTRINLFTKSEIQREYGSSIVHIEDVGLKTPISSGLTLICLIES
ncbi:MAG: methyltransferase domain-containing protein [bacterium]|nr:methyltransferase domain-containing protein [bacterium]